MIPLIQGATLKSTLYLPKNTLYTPVPITTAKMLNVMISLTVPAACTLRLEILRQSKSKQPIKAAIPTTSPDQ